MAAGLPIASSSLGPMPEILGDSGVYFDPRKVHSIVGALRILFNDHVLRGQLAVSSFEKARDYSWEKSASETFFFIAKVIKNIKD